MHKRRSPSAIPTDPGDPASLPDAEMDVLACLWEQKEGTARSVRQAMASYRPMTQGSAITLLRRLQNRGLVDRHRAERGKTYIYTATQPPEVAYQRIVNELIVRVFRGNRRAMFTSMLESGPLSEDERKVLEDLMRRQNQNGPQDSPPA
ncbi:MAG: BlaI/MecI/CopY family transcriptional regulator [Phycisphaeraceae bacterium]|nr:BlaI/MecI/CopY family transcriptional regulator [Phycisphaeraceae bacterium]